MKANRPLDGLVSGSGCGCLIAVIVIGFIVAQLFL